ncbi:MAG: hypothetical protein ABIB61_01280 [Candidatus Shapirobacteria bacterium]
MNETDEFLEKLGIKPASSDFNDFIRKTKEKAERSRPGSDQRLVDSLRTFNNEIATKIDLVYYPCCGLDISPSVAFPESKVVYVDSDRMTINKLILAGYEAHNASALEYQLKQKADIVLIVNPTDIDLNNICQQAGGNGFVLCNNYHATATAMASNEDYELTGYLDWSEEESKYVEDRKEALEEMRSKRDVDILFVFRRKADAEGFDRISQ